MTETQKEQEGFIDTPGPLTGRNVIISGQNATIGNIVFFIEEEANYQIIYSDGTKSKTLFTSKFLMNPSFCQILPPKP
jgi:hypothetical protein